MRFILPFLLLLSCSSFASSSPDIKAISQQYFKTYSQRSDFEKFMSFYTEEVVLDDLIYGFKATGKKHLTEFFNWPYGNFKVIGNKPALVISSQVIDGLKVSTTGVFNRFEYMGKEMGPWRFIIYQEFNQAGKIKYQEDWINYTPRDNFLGGENLNPKQ